VLQQAHKAKFVAMDTMNFWITGALANLKKTLAAVDCLIINDSEVRLLSGEYNVYTGARVIQDMGPRTLIIKKGEHGSILIHNDSSFVCPAFPVEQLFDPTGAGDTFAGGFMGYLAMMDDVSDANLRRAMVVGTVLASFCVESFSADRLRALTESAIQERLTAFLHLIQVEPDHKWLKL
jgi:sugar/nucleoside kinase (ribokinase family)